MAKEGLHILSFSPSTGKEKETRSKIHMTWTRRKLLQLSVLGEGMCSGEPGSDIQFLGHKKFPSSYGFPESLYTDNESHFIGVGDCIPI